VVEDRERDSLPVHRLRWTTSDVGAGDLPFEPFLCGLDINDHHYLIENDDAAPEVGGSFGDAERSDDYLASLRERACALLVVGRVGRAAPAAATAGRTAAPGTRRRWAAARGCARSRP
jgi:hypothetical protein